jgi:hypothetical protein
MKHSNTIMFLFATAITSMIFAGGCSGDQKTVPHMGFGNLNISTDLSRNDIVVLDQVEGSSTTDNILCGIIQFVDGDKLRLFGIPFFTEKYTSFEIGMSSTERRAYYKALEAAPEADTVFYKSMDYEISGLAPLWWTETVTYRGKGIKLKSDQ